MRLVVLAAGESSRFWPLNYEHKGLIKILGKPLIAHLLEALPSAIDEVVIVEPSTKDYSRRRQEISRYSKVPIKFVTQPEPLGMWDALLRGAEDYGEDVLVTSPFHFSGKILSKLASMEGIALVLSEVEDPSLYGIAFVKDNKVVGIKEKPKYHIGNLAVNSIYRLTHEFIEFLKAYPGEDHYKFEAALDAYLKEKPASFFTVPKEEVPSLKYPWHALDIMKRLFSKLKDQVVLGDISETSRLIGPVYIDEGAEVLEYAIIKGPAYIGKNVVVGDHVLIRQSDIEEKSIIGYGSEIPRSLIQEDTHIHHSFIGDSVLGRSNRIGFGTVTANRRLDRNEVFVKLRNGKVVSAGKSFGCATGEKVATGINSMIMPGTLIASGEFIYPGEVVKGIIARRC